MTTRKLMNFADPGHSWLRVRRSDLGVLGIADDITSFSFQKGTWVYLEEDCDAGTYFKAARSAGWSIAIKTRNSNSTSSIRGYPRYTS